MTFRHFISPFTGIFRRLDTYLSNITTGIYTLLLSFFPRANSLLDALFVRSYLPLLSTCTTLLA